MLVSVHDVIVDNQFNCKHVKFPASDTHLCHKCLITPNDDCKKKKGNIWLCINMRISPEFLYRLQSKIKTFIQKSSFLPYRTALIIYFMFPHLFDNRLYTLKSNMTAWPEILPPQDINVWFWLRASATYNLALCYYFKGVVMLNWTAFILKSMNDPVQHHDCVWGKTPLSTMPK